MKTGLFLKIGTFFDDTMAGGRFMNDRYSSGFFSIVVAFTLSFGFAACSSSSNDDHSNVTPRTVPAANLNHGQLAIAGTGSTKGTVSLTQKIVTQTVLPMAVFTEGWGSKEVSIDLGTYDQTHDFGGENASMTLVGQVQNYPDALLDTDGKGGAFAVLTSFSVDPADGSPTVEYVNTTPQCQSEGMWECGITNGNNICDPHAACTVVSGASGFGGRTDWDQHQVPPYGYVTTNSFPRCDASLSGWSNCPAGFSSLVSGHYHAKYLLLSDSGTPTDGYAADLKIILSIKKDTAGRGATSVNGGINLNLILVGDQNVNDAHTDAGARNLNLLFSEVNRIFSVGSGVNVFVNQIKTYEWPDANGGDQYSQVAYEDLGDLFEAGSKGVDAADEGQNINIFIVSDIQYSGANFTVLGLAGGILGPPINGTQASGLAFSSFGKLAAYNPACTHLACGRNFLQSDFLEMAGTIVHELGHYFGLNHPSEKASLSGTQENDALNDTPTCLARTSGFSYVLDQRACYYTDTTVQAAPFASSCQSACDAATAGSGNVYLSITPTSSAIDPWTSYANSDMPHAFCPLVSECQHNHVMWYTTKNRQLQKSDGTDCTQTDLDNGQLCTWSEDGDLFSSESSALIQWDYFLR